MITDAVGWLCVFKGLFGYLFKRYQLTFVIESQRGLICFCCTFFWKETPGLLGKASHPQPVPLPQLLGTTRALLHGWAHGVQVHGGCKWRISSPSSHPQLLLLCKWGEQWLISFLKIFQDLCRRSSREGTVCYYTGGAFSKLLMETLAVLSCVWYFCVHR